MKINKIISFFLTIIILMFSFCPLAFATDNDNLINPDMSTWDIDNLGLVSNVQFIGGTEHRNRIVFNYVSSSDDLKIALLHDLTSEIITGKNYNLSFDLLTYEMHNVSFLVQVIVEYFDGSTSEFYDLVEGGKSNTNPNYTKYSVNFTPKIENKGYKSHIAFYFWRDSGPVIAGANCTIKNLSLSEVESKEGNILKRIYNFIINLPSTFQNFFTDLKNGISSFFSDLKDNLSNWFDNLKNSIGNFFGNLSDNLSDFFNKLKNWLLWFNAEGASSYTNPFEQVDDDIEDGLESNIVKLANYINDNTQSVSDSLAKIGSVFLVFDTFVVGIPLVLSLVIFAFFVHILKRLLGF